MKRYFIRLLLVAACWLSTQGELQAQFLPQSYTIPQVVVHNNGNGTQTVTYYWSPLAANITTVFLLYMPIGGTTWINPNTGSATSPQAITIPVGSYSYAIGLNSISNVVLMNGTIPALDYNYIRSWDATAPDQSATDLITRPLTDVKQITAYMDGFGRPLQTVEKQKSPAGNDQVTAKYYDAMGRGQTYQYLPFTANSLANSADIPNDGNFKADPFQQQAAYYNSGNSTSPIKGQSETYFYGQAVYETSPMDRVINTYAAGNNWVGSQGGSSPKSTQKQYLTNNATDNVYMFNVAWTPTLAPAPPQGLQVSIVNNGNSTQTVTYNWASLGSTAETVCMLYRAVGATSWTDASCGSPVSPGAITIPSGTWQYAIEAYFSSGSPQIITTGIGASPTGAPVLAVSLVNNGNGTQTATYNWSTLTNVGTVLCLYSPLGVTPNWQDPSAGSPTGPRSVTIPTGNFQYAIELISSVGSPPQIIEAPMITTATYSSTASYAAGQLKKTITTDENNNQTVEFTDFDGKLILKKVQAAASVTDGYTGWLCTYYIYDDYGMLRMVMPPLATNAYLAGQTIASFQDALCYRYEYDQRHRQIVKKAPGVGEKWMVYDTRDRVVLSQDADMRAGNSTGTANQWVYVKYDGLNRPVMTGLYTDITSTTQAAEQANLNLQNLGLFETYAAGSFPQYSLTNSYPSVASASILSVEYYDDYTWVSGSGSGLTATLNTTGSSNLKAASSTYPYTQALIQSPQTKGMATGNSLNVLGTTTYLYNENIYDAKSRVIQKQATNVTAGIDITSNQYDWEGKVLVNLVQHQKGGTNAQSYTVVSTMNYDAMDRLTSVTKNISNGTISDQQTIQTSTYDESSNLKTKTFETGLDELTYDYNIRGWLLGINRAYLGTVTNPTNIAPSAGNWFGLELAYDKTTSSAVDNTYAAAQFNGNMAGTVWKTAGDGIGKKYDFTYDNANRLAGANYTQDNGSGGYDVSAGMNFSVSNLSYDANGNILKMYEMGWQVGKGSSTIDQLQYTYPANSNQLQNVINPNSNASTTLGDFRYSAAYTKVLNGPKPTTANDYAYDPDGNLTADKNKDITSITYNYLNLPQLITIVNASGTNTIQYTYDALGNKLKKTTNEAAGTFTDPYNLQTYTTTIQTITTYVAGFVYQTKSYNSTVNALTPVVTYTDQLQYCLLQEEGRIRALYKNTAAPASLTGFAYDFFEKDHLGNTRLILTDEAETDYYPPTTLEGATSSTSSPVSYESSFYTINPTYIVPATSVTGLPAYLNNASTYNYTTTSNLYPSSNNAGNTDAASNSANVYRINGSLNKTGLGITLKVMAGDKVSIGGQSYYFSNNAGDNSSYNLPVLTMLTGFLGAPGVSSITTAGDAGVTASGLDGVSTLVTNITNYLTNSAGGNTRTPMTGTKPRAYINWVFFDDQFNYAGGGFYPVGTAGTVQSYTTAPASTVLQNIIAPKSGFVYVYCSNESPVDVFFDNIQVVDTRGPLLEEDHYYPFGLSMAGISDKALKTQYVLNKYRYGGKELQNQEFSDGSGLEEYDYGARLQDPQLGVWHSIDPLTEVTANFSPYAYCFNNPFRFADPTGMDGEDEDGGEDGGGGGDPSSPQRVKYLYNKTTGEVTTQNVSEDEYQANTQGGTTNLVSGDPSGGGVLMFDYARSDGGTGAFTTDKYEGTNTDDKGLRDDQYQYTGAHYETFAKDEGGGSNAALEKTNTIDGAFLVGWGMKQELFEFAVRDRAGLSRRAFNALSESERTASELAALGSAGAKYLKFVKGVGIAGGVVSAGISAYSAGNYYAHGGTKASVGIKAGIDIVMTGVGFLGPIGFGISALYFIVDAASNHFGGYGSTEDK